MPTREAFPGRSHQERGRAQGAEPASLEMSISLCVPRGLIKFRDCTGGASLAAVNFKASLGLLWTGSWGNKLSPLPGLGCGSWEVTP